MDYDDASTALVQSVLGNAAPPAYGPRSNFVESEPPLYGLLNPDDNYGMVERGNIDLNKRPVVQNPDGTISTVRSMSVNFDGDEVLLPTVGEEGVLLSEREAIDRYLSTGNHLGKFRSVEGASSYAEALHNEQAAMYQEEGASDGGQ